MAKVKKNTVRRKMSLREYITFAHFLETGEREIDLSQCLPSALNKREVRVMYLSKEQREELDSFINEPIFSQTVDEMIAALPKINQGGM